MRRRPWVLWLVLVLPLLTGSLTVHGAGLDAVEPAAAAVSVPRPDHTVVVVLENRNRTSVLGSGRAPYLDQLAARGANLSQSYGVTHPSQPNYLALFSGSTQGVTSDACPQNFSSADNLGAQLLRAGLTFTGYAESLPAVGATDCIAGQYQRKHAPWVDFGSVPASSSQPFSAFPTNFATLPTVAFVTPNMCNDMHDCGTNVGDAWMRTNIEPYAQWAMTHNSLLVVTFDENEGGTVNQIPTLLVGPMVRPGTYTEQADHYTLLRTMEDAYRLPALGNAATAAPLSTIWGTTPPPPPAPAVVNGGFEDGVTGWATSGLTTVVTKEHHGGAAAASNGYARGDSVLAQTFVAPAASSKLTVWWKPNCRDTLSKAWTTVIVRRNTSATVSTLVARTCTVSSTWKSASVSLTPGHSYTVQLVTHDDADAAPNITYFDDVVVS